MAGLAIVVGDSSYAGPNVGYALPVSRGARTLLFPRLDAATSIANKVDALAGGVGNASAIGSPAYAAGYATLTPAANFLSTLSTDAPTSTILCAFRTASVGSTGPTTFVIGGNFLLSTSGYQVYIDNGPFISARRVTTVSATPTNSSILRVACALSTWTFAAVVFESGTGMTVYNKTAGTSLFSALATPPVAGATTVRAGSANTSSAGGPGDIAFWAEHNVALTSSEINDIYNTVKLKMAAYSTPLTI